MTLFGNLVPFERVVRKASGPASSALYSPLSDFDLMVNRLLGSNAVEGVQSVMPRLDVSETEKSYIITAELPGVEDKDINVDLHDGVLTIAGEKRSEAEDSGKTWHRVERRYGSFSRALTLPADADEQAIEAVMKNGLLTITVAKTVEAQTKSRKIDIKTQ